MVDNKNKFWELFLKVVDDWYYLNCDVSYEQDPDIESKIENFPFICM